MLGSPSSGDRNTLNTPKLLSLGASLLLSTALLAFPAFGTAGDIMEKAQQLERGNNFQQALTQYEKILSADRGNLQALRGKAHCLVGLNQPKDALKIYDELMTKTHGKSGALSSERAIALYFDHEAAKAMAAWNEALKETPHRPLPLKWRAIAYMQQGQFKKALVDLDEYVDCCPNSWTARSCRSLARATIGDYLGSLEDLNRYIYIKRNMSFHIRYSAVRADVEDKSQPGPVAPPEMQLSLSQAGSLREGISKKLAPDTIAALRAQAVLSFYEHDYRRALKELGKIKAGSGSNIDQATLLALKSMCERALGDFPAAIKSARLAISIEPSQRAFYELLDGAYYVADQREEGLQALNAYLKQSPKNIAILLTLSAIDSQLGNRDQARELANRVLAMQPNCVDALLLRADMYKADLKNDLASADFAKAKLLAPKNGEAVEGLGFACYELNQTDKALENFQTALKLGYDLRRIYVATALCLDRKGKHADATRFRTESNDLAL
jgi:tetratricopeptide (TPR) repeat protein